MSSAIAKKTNVYLVRHGRSCHNLPANNKSPYYAGSRINSDLIDEGKNDARLLGNKLINIKFGLIISSTLTRSCQTAKIIKRIAKNSPEYLAMKDIIEVDVGDFTGLTRKEAKELDPSPRKYTRQKFTFKNGDDFESISKRVRKFKVLLNGLSESNENILIVGHSMINQFILNIVDESNNDFEIHDFGHSKIVKIEI